MSRVNVVESAIPMKEDIMNSEEGVKLLAWFTSLNDNEQKKVFTALLEKVQEKPQVVSSIARDIAPFVKRDFVSELPKKLAMHVLSYCDATSLCHSALVAKKWKALADDDSLWHRMCSQHINKKCKRCGWGLPLVSENESDIDKGNVTGKRLFEENDCNTTTGEEEADRAAKRVKRPEKCWKMVYAERMIVEKNWRKGLFRADKFSGHTDGVLCLEFDKDTMVSAGLDRDIRVWNVKTSQCTNTIKMENTVKCLQFDKKKVIAGCVDGGIRIICLCSGSCVRKIEAHRGQVNSLQFDDVYLVSGGTDSIVQLWNFQNGKCNMLKGHTDSVTCVRLHTGKVLSGSEDSTLRLWDLKTMTCQLTFRGHKDTITCAQLSHSIIVSGSLDNTIKIWNTQTGECLNTLFSHTGGVNCIQFDSLRIVSGSEDGTIKVWDRQTGHCMYTLQAHSQSINTLQFDDSMIVTGSDDCNIKMFNFTAE
eukprot:CFRG6141T1